MNDPDKERGSVTDTTSSEWALEGPRRLRQVTRPLPDLKPGWARIRFLYCGICGSDLSKFEGLRELSYPVSLGHEFVARVVGVSDGVDSVCVGDVVTSDLNYRCGACLQCRTKRSHLCLEGQIGLFTNRAFAELADLHAGYLLRVSASPSPHLALTEPLSCVLHAKNWAGPTRTDRVLIVGAGSLGTCMAFALCNDESCGSFDVLEENPRRSSLIADAVGRSGGAVSQPARGYDVIFDMSGTESGLHVACTSIGAGGTVCSMSHLDGSAPASFLLRSLTRRDVSFKVSYLNGERRNLEDAARMLQERWTDSWDQLIEVVPSRRIQNAFEGRRRSGWCKTVVQVGEDVAQGDR